MSNQHLRPGPPARSPAREAEVDAPREEGNPWEQRERLGWMRAATATCLLFALHPVRGFARTRARGGFRGPFWFAFVVIVVSSLASEVTSTLYDIATIEEGSRGLGEIFALEMEGRPVAGARWLPVGVLGLAGVGGCLFGLVIGIPVSLLLLPVLLLVWSALLHLCLWLVGGLRRSESGYQGTWASICYATPALVLGVLPVVGDVLALLLPVSIPLALWWMKTMGWIGSA